MNRLLIVGILIISMAPLYAEGQQPNTADLKEDAQKIVRMISGNKAKTQIQRFHHRGWSVGLGQRSVGDHFVTSEYGLSVGYVKLKLGRMLFFDPILSESGSRSCANCHNPGLSWADGQPRAVGLAQDQLPLRTPTLLGVAWIPKLGWNGHFRDLESVAITPITSPKMMNLAEASMVERLSAIPGYIDAFKNAFGSPEIDRGKIEQALATFERSIMPSRGRFDSFIDGDKTAIGQSAARGFDLFNGKANCATCHSGWAFTDASFHDIGSAKGDDRGRGNLFANSVMLQYAFKTPTLRDVARRAPYMHDGSVPTLDAVIDLYDRGGIDRPSRAPEIHPLGLTNTEKADLLAFLQTLTGEPAVIPYPVLPR